VFSGKRTEPTALPPSAVTTLVAACCNCVSNAWSVASKNQLLAALVEDGRSGALGERGGAARRFGQNLVVATSSCGRRFRYETKRPKMLRERSENFARETISFRERPRKLLESLGREMSDFADSCDFNGLGPILFRGFFALRFPIRPPRLGQSILYLRIDR
jgi:hypothetical protein